MTIRDIFTQSHQFDEAGKLIYMQVWNETPLIFRKMWWAPLPSDYYLFYLKCFNISNFTEISLLYVLRVD